MKRRSELGFFLEEHLLRYLHGKEGRLVLLKAHQMNLSSAVLGQLKRDITAEKKMREAATPVKAPGLGEGPNRLGGRRQFVPAGEE
jgi:hypothetical protein